MSQKSPERASIDATDIHLPLVHPGLFLKEEMEERQLTANSLSLMLRVPATRVGKIIHGERSISPDTALRLEECLDIPAALWMRLQAAYDLDSVRASAGARIKAEVQHAA
jgi:addiction module HigA family antidote